ncbi:MAG: type II toxin-antitoxin system HicB family antitoxin [Magnetococcales bacterium]|nr:type II toxin-antitoxin system HicB family antitoxin [Magnetococcales bacterium]MBF0152047.1 type II toxin-antitoxin system HicB family antitoxin [Magnetococcales bacterium]MBF0174940.1 type II toxin-antitoxin system HicB family antitoxin [Magnetococcales bacterium]MBF0632959.1 type II toxin-antitoxin system HicB family antitoxin [Magnetococcales bacterium]
MLLEYMHAAMRQARYETLSDDGSFYGEISVCRGVHASDVSLERCKEVLAEVLEEWILFRIHRNLDLPVIDGLEIKIREVA